MQHDIRTPRLAIPLRAGLSILLPIMGIWALLPLLRECWNVSAATWEIALAIRVSALLLVPVAAYCGLRLAAAVTRWIFASDIRAR